MRTVLFFSVALMACSGGHLTELDACAGRRPGDLLITEFLADPAGTDSGHEWFELFNALDADVELAGLTLFSGDKTHLVRTGTIGPHGYFVFGDVRSGALPAFEGYSYGNDLGELPQSGGHFGVRCKETVIDEVTYTVAAKPGHARQLDGRTDPVAGGEWCDANLPLDGGNFGTPSARNTFCGLVLDAGCTAPAPGDLEISEVMANPRAVSDSAGEWVEVHALNACDLRGVSLGSGVLRGEGCIHLEAGEWAVLAKSFDAGLPNIHAMFSSSLLNSASTVALSLGDAGVASVDLPAALDGVSWQRDPASAAFCAATVAYETGDFGTPGTPNTACATHISTAQCIDPITSEPRDVRVPSFGDLAISEWMPDPTVVADNVGEWIELHAFRPVDLNGLMLNGSALSSGTCLAVDAGQLVLLARSADPAKNGGLPAVTATFGSDLVNSGGTVSLKLADGGVLDSLTYPAATRGASFFVDGSRCDPLQYAQPPPLCVTPAGTVYGSGDRGTPGATNGACP